MNDHPFPVDKSLLSAAALSRAIEAEYGLADVRCQLLTATLRDVYLVSSNEGRYVLCVYRHEHRPTDEIRAEWQFVDYLGANGVPDGIQHLALGPVGVGGVGDQLGRRGEVDAVEARPFHRR